MEQQPTEFMNTTANTANISRTNIFAGATVVNKPKLTPHQQRMRNKDERFRDMWTNKCTSKFNDAMNLNSN